MKLNLTLIFILFFISPIFSQYIHGDIKSWTKDDLLGFDDVGDCSGNFGDITSVYARTSGNILLIRVSFDNMVIRKDNKVQTDFFAMNPVRVEIKLKSLKDQADVFNMSINTSELQGKDKQLNYLRTPSSNLLEFEIDLKKQIARKNIDFDIRVYKDNILLDGYKGNGNGTKANGNCAFVHHGNQGLTYTDVFYGNAYGISGLDGSGYDEVLQVHEATGIPGNFHMSGTLMPAAQWHNPEFNDWLRTLAGNGIASMMTSALGQHIMPFVQNSMNDWSVYVESQMVNYQYNYVPHIAWVPERTWLAPGHYPDAGVADWIGDNWAQHGVWGVVLDDWPHLNGYDNRKIHWMNNGSGVNLRVIPINNTFVGNMHYDAQAAKNQIAGMGYGNICVYGTDWEVAAEMNEHDGTWFLDNYESVLWYCHDNYPGINVWKLEDAIQNPDFNGTGAEITPGCYGLLGGTGGYGGSNNSWYTNWASTPSHSDYHDPKWNYGFTWWDAYLHLTGVNDNQLAQLGWYTLMINLHETAWHSGGQIADWEHRYSSHIKNANVYAEASRWADGQYAVTTACYFDDIDHDGIQELVMHNDKVFMVFESIGGKANWVFYKNGLGQAYSVVSSDMAYWSETDGDYNESSNNHLAALSDVSPNQQNATYNIAINQVFGDTVQATLTQYGVSKTLTLYTGKDYLDVVYDFYDQTGYVKSGWSPDLLDLIWTGKDNLQRIWGANGKYCGYRNSASGATAALVLGNGGASHNTEVEGTLVRGDEIKGYRKYKVRLFAGYTSVPSGTSVSELDMISTENMDVFEPELFSPAVMVTSSTVQLNFSEALDLASSQNIGNYSFSGFDNTYTIVSAVRQSDWSKVKLTISGNFVPGDDGIITVVNVKDLNNNTIGSQNAATFVIPDGITHHTINIDGINDFIAGSEKMDQNIRSLYITWDANNLYIGLYSLNLGTGGDFFVNIDTDQTPGSGAVNDSWGRAGFSGAYLPEYQVAVEGGGNTMQVNHWTGTAWTYPGYGAIGQSYEGWASNGLTELSIPWSALGNPAGIAISAHITQENNQTVTEVFPMLNPTGNHPTLTYMYAFFSPYIGGNMPLEGVIPNQAVIVPNTGPFITSYNPLSLSLTLPQNASQAFSITASDGQGDPLFYTWKLDGLNVGSTESYNYNSGTNTGLHLIQAIVSDNIPGNYADTVTWSVQVLLPNTQLSLKCYLEGPFNATVMNTGLNTQNYIPLSQPYNTTPWNYSGTESVSLIPGIHVVDWILVELRQSAGDASTAGSAAMIGRQAAFILDDGSIVSADGNTVLSFSVTVTQNLFAVIWHRNHLGIMSSVPLTETGGIYTYDFSDASSKVYGGSNGHKQLSLTQWGMVAGDGDSNGQVNNTDKNQVWKMQSGNSGYLKGDFSMDGQVNNMDKVTFWKPNTGRGSLVVN